MSDKTISRTKIIAAIEALGLDPKEVAGIEMTPDAVTTTRLIRNAEGKFVFHPSGVGLMCYTDTFEVVDREAE